MKKQLFFLFAAATVLFAACSKGVSGPSNPPPPPPPPKAEVSVKDDGLSGKTGTIATFVAYQVVILPEGTVTSIGVYFKKEDDSGPLEGITLKNLSASFSKTGYTKQIPLPVWDGTSSPLTSVMETMSNTLVLAISGESAVPVQARVELHLFVKLPNKKDPELISISLHPSFTITN